MSPGMYARRDIPKWMTGLKDAENVLLLSQGGVSNRAGTQLATGFDTSDGVSPQFLIPFEASDDDTYMLEFGDAVMRVIKDGSYVLSTAIAGQSVTAVTAANPAKLTMVSGAAAALFTVGRLVYLSDPNGSSVLHDAILKVTAISGAAITFQIVGGVTINTTTGSWGTVGSGALLYEVYQVTSPYAIEDMPYVQFAQDVDTMFLAHSGYSPQKLVRVSDASWSFTALTFAPEIGTPTGINATASTGTGSTTYTYTVAAVDAETGEEGLPGTEDSVTNDLTTATYKNTITWSAVTGADYYRVYKEYNGIMGYIGITEALTFDDENITPNTAENPQTARNPFSTSGDKPAVAAFVEQRLTFGATANNPQAVEMSRSTTPLNFNRALTPGASDAISFKMRSQKLNRVYHIIDAERPLILTAGAEWYLRTDSDAPVAPGNFALKARTFRGSARTPRPLLVGETMLHVTRDGNSLREFALNLSQDTASADLTILARHLFEGKTINSMAYAQSPNSVVWVTLTDGSLYSLTYLQEHEVWGWTRHQIAGTGVKVKQVAVVTEGAFDTPYFVVERTLYGGTATLVERLDTRQFTGVSDAYFVDCGFYTAGISSQTLRGFLHLRGEDVSVLADGNVLDGIAVNAQGVVDLLGTYGEASVGLGYDAYIVTLEADFGDQIAQLGSSIGSFVAANDVAVKVVDTRGIAVGLEGGVLNEVKEFSGASPIPLATQTHVVPIDSDWDRDMAIEVRQTYPLPMTITAIAPDWALADE